MADQLGLFNQRGSKDDNTQLLVQPIEPITLISSYGNKGKFQIGDNGRFRFLNNYELHGNYLNRVLTQYVNLGNHSIKENIRNLSIPSARIKGIGNFLKANDLISDDERITLFGMLLLKNDPHLLDKGLLWLLHYFTSSNANLLLWSRLFNDLLESGEEVSPKVFIGQYFDVIAGMKQKTFIWNGSNEIGAILRTYSEGLFKPLKFMIHNQDKHIFIQDDFYIPDSIWLACILVYRDRYFPGVASLENDQIIYGEYSPGKIFRQNDTKIRVVLDKLHNKGLVSVETRLGLDQIRFKDNYSWLDAVNSYFEEDK